MFLRLEDSFGKFPKNFRVFDKFHQTEKNFGFFCGLHSDRPAMLKIPSHVREEEEGLMSERERECKEREKISDSTNEEKLALPRGSTDGF